MVPTIDPVERFSELICKNGGVSSIDVSETDVRAVRKVVMDGRRMRILPASVWRSLDWNAVRLVLHNTGTYVVPTEELLDYLDELIGDYKTIEIAAGNGWIGRELDIPLTDSCLQRDNKVVALSYKMMEQPTIHYPKDIIKLEASAAVRRFKPHTVLGCFATHKWRDDVQQGNCWGIDFEDIYAHVQRIILVGNIKIHGYNPLMELPHQTIELPGLITRCNDDLNRIFIWEHGD